MVLGGVLRSVAGWKADKYQFEVTIHSAYNLLPGTKALQVQWKRGTKSTATKPVKAQRGEALWDEETREMTTMTLLRELRADGWQCEELFRLVREGRA